jgi:hypothetical protein
MYDINKAKSSLVFALLLVAGDTEWELYCYCCLRQEKEIKGLKTSSATLGLHTAGRG